MKVQLTIEVDETDAVCDEIIDELELTVEHELYLSVMTSTGFIDGALVAVEELPALGAPRKENS